MRLLPTMAVLGLTLAASPALAWGDMGGGYVNEFQPAQNEIAIWAYPAKHNYCPAGLQPVMIGGAVCCGTPTHTGYQSHPVHRAPAPRGNYIATGKGYGEGYYEGGGGGYLGN